MKSTSSKNKYYCVGQSNTKHVFLTWYYNATDSNAYAALSTYGGTNNLVLNHDGGYVGIGTTNPSYNLHIHNSNIPYIHLTNSTTGTTNNDGTSISLYEYDLYIRNREDGGNIKIQTKDGSTEAMTILANGNIGIGTSSPEAPLSVTTTTSSYSPFPTGVHGKIS